MKTPDQIREWLQAQEWYPQFVENVRKEPDNKQQFILSGEALYQTISGAFLWLGTPKGHKFWKNINSQFVKWYNKEETK